jgi:peptide/nickel transport system substrate-binding protein
MEMDEIWGSDLERSPFNFIGFRNQQVDRILQGAKHVAKEIDYANSWKEFQVILQREQPRTFLYWKNDLVVVNARVKGMAIGILGLTHHAWDWHLEGAGPSHD